MPKSLFLHAVTCRSFSLYWLLLFLEQATPKTFDYVLVAPVAEEDDQKAQRQSAFIKELEKKNISITVSASTLTRRSVETPTPSVLNLSLFFLFLPED